MSTKGCKRILNTTVMLFVTSAIFVGCSKKTETTPKLVDTEMQVQQLLEQADLYYSEGKTNEAVMLLKDAYASEEYKEYSKSIVWALLNTYIQQQNIEDAKKLYLETLENNPEVATPLFGSIEYSIKSDGDVESLDEWCFMVAKHPNAQVDLQAQALWYLEEAYSEAANWMKVSDIITYAYENLTAPIKYKFVDASMRQVLAANQYATLDTLVSNLKLSSKDDAELQSIIVDVEFNALVKQDKLAEAQKLYEDNFSAMSERSKNNNFSVLLSAYNKASKFVEADALIDFAKKDISVDSSSYKLVMRAWVKQAKLEEKPVEAQNRVVSIIQSDATEKFKQSIVSSFFYYLMENIPVENKKVLVANVKELLMNSTDEMVKEPLASISLDGCFLLNDFDGAIEVVNNYEWPEENTAMRKDKLLPKIKAHKALLVEDYPEAVKNFRVFMDVIKLEPDEKYMDPYTGQQISVDSILGLNALRIAGLWEKAGDSEKAAAAQKEALGYYKDALAKEKEDSAQYKSISEQIKKLESK
ncbi:MAG: hypothetical protein PF692_12210 [Kiritimatiellae bacterium]|nr:hypothetical protein [Kiritimatiellia bacterium]